MAGLLPWNTLLTVKSARRNVGSGRTVVAENPARIGYPSPHDDPATESELVVISPGTGAGTGGNQADPQNDPVLAHQRRHGARSEGAR